MLKEKIQELLSKRNLLVPCLVMVLVVGGLLAVGLLGEKNVEVVVDGKSQTLATRAKTVEESLADANINIQPEDKVEPELNSKIENGQVITVSRAVEISLSADWQTATFKIAPTTVAEVLKEKGITLGKNDWVEPKADEMVTEGTAIKVSRVNYVQRDDTILIQPKEIRRNDATLERGSKKVLSQGAAGQEKVTYEITYIDGKPANKTEVARNTVKSVEDKVVAYGTLSVASRSGRNFSFSRSLDVKATAYTYTGYRTATGSNPRVGTVAVDPRVIPLGTKLYIEGYGYAKAEDTGGAIKGNKIDVFLGNESACQNWGIKSVKVYVLD